MEVYPEIAVMPVVGVHERGDPERLALCVRAVHDSEAVERAAAAAASEVEIHPAIGTEPRIGSDDVARLYCAAMFIRHGVSLPSLCFDTRSA